MYREDNVYDIKGSRTQDRGRENVPASRVPKKNKKQNNKRSPLSAFVIVLFLVLTYLIIQFINIDSQNKVSIYEVKANALSYETKFQGVAVRDERLVYAEHSGYISYFVRDNRKSAKNSIIYSVDSSSGSSNALKKNFDEKKLDDNQIKTVKASISKYLKHDSTTLIKNIGAFRDNLDNMIYDFISGNMIEDLREISSLGLTGNSFHVCRTPVAGVVSYKYDDLVGIKTSDVNADMFGKTHETKNLRSTGLISTADPVYRICSDENWSVICKVTEEFYVNNVDLTEANVYIGDKISMLTVSVTPFSNGTDYFMELSLNKYMSEFINERVLDVRFVTNFNAGLKIPSSAVVQKEYYLVPVSLFSKNENDSEILIKEFADTVTGQLLWQEIYPSRYYTDGNFAYIEKDIFEDGDYVVNPDTGEKFKISVTNKLEGVYNINKGFYQFVRIERIETGSDYLIISPVTPDGIRQYDHIALDGSKGIEGMLIL